MANALLDEAVKRTRVGNRLTSGADPPDPEETDSEDAAAAEEELETEAAGGDTQEPEAEASPTPEQPAEEPAAEETGANRNALGFNDIFGAPGPQPEPTRSEGLVTYPVRRVSPGTTYPTITSEGEPYQPDETELPAITVEGHVPESVALASREMRPPPEGYGVAPRAELVRMPGEAPDTLAQVER